MGHGSYTSSDWTALRKSAGISHTATANQIFTSRNMPENLNPRHIALREARDSDDHPNSTPVMIGLDVTGSMGYLAEEIAKNSLNETMLKLYEMKPIPDPQLMFAAIGDATDKAPLQVTQFESDIRIGKQLLQLWLEGQGGDGPEDYPLLWYFAARHTACDSWLIRKKPGYLITIGDADCHREIGATYFNRIFCGAQELNNLTAQKLAKEAGARFELFHIHLTSSISTRVPNLEAAIPGRIVYLPKNKVDHLPKLIISLMQVSAGMDISVSAAQWGQSSGVIQSCLSSLQLRRGNAGFSF